ncbi:PAAR domain-containing protein [Deinococcus altitudinis]|uniref:PAAR domain-containing protein n=1 Tax=Deinococcus altitudinis TaxID=468914 RepID=UPI00389144E8
MSQPAIRLGDAGTHGGVTTTGAATVLIGGLPAARIGDAHPEPVHGPQVIVTGAATVLIEGRPAARAADLVGCSAALVPTQTTVLIGS